MQNITLQWRSRPALLLGWYAFKLNNAFKPNNFYIMYCSLVRPSLEYSTVVWIDTSRKNINKYREI